jgi:hypothetical protein
MDSGDEPAWFKPSIPFHCHEPRSAVDQTNAYFRTSRVSMNVSERFLHKCEKRSNSISLGRRPTSGDRSSRTSILLRSANASTYQRTAESNPPYPATARRAHKKRCTIHSIAARRLRGSLIRGSPKCAQRIEGSASEFLPPGVSGSSVKQQVSAGQAMQVTAHQRDPVGSPTLESPDQKKAGAD